MATRIWRYRWKLRPFTVGSPNLVARSGQAKTRSEHMDIRKAVLPEVGTKKRLDPRIVRQIVDDLGLDSNELPGPTSRV